MSNTNAGSGPTPSVPRDHPSHGHEHEPHSLDPRQVMATRELFWQNVIREILTSLSMVCALRPTTAGSVVIPTEELDDSAIMTGEEQYDENDADEGNDEARPGPILNMAAGKGAESPGQQGSGVPAKRERVAEGAGAIDRPAFDAQLFDGRLAVITRRGERVPIADVFPLFACGIDSPRDRVLSIALECTVFQIRTPAGEVYTLPLHEIATFQALSPELMRRLAAMSRRRGDEGSQQPFGFAAFTSIARETPPPMTEGAEEEGVEEAGEEG